MLYTPIVIPEKLTSGAILVLILECHSISYRYSVLVNFST